MRKILLFIVFLCGFFCSQASDSLRFTKVFQIEIDSVYNFYIDSIGTISGGAEVCFQTTTNKLVKTSINGTVLSTTGNPYKYFTFWNGDTIILENKSILSVNGDTIANATGAVALSAECRFIVASTDGIYIYVGGDINTNGTGWSWQIQNVLSKKDNNNPPIFSSPINGLCFYRGDLYYINYLTSTGIGSVKSKKVTESNGKIINETIPFQQPVGIAGNGGYLYVFSNYEKTLYRLESSQGTVNIETNQREILESIYFNLSGQRINAPSGLTIVVTRYTDGTVRTEKKIF